MASLGKGTAFSNVLHTVLLSMIAQGWALTALSSSIKSSRLRIGHKPALLVMMS